MDVLSHRSTHRRLECDGRLALVEGQKCHSEATPATEQSSSGSPLLSSSEEGPRKGGLYLDCPILSWPEKRIRRDPFSGKDHQRQIVEYMEMVSPSRMRRRDSRLNCLSLAPTPLDAEEDIKDNF